MAGKTFQLRCTSEQAEELASALETFALAAYPPGGSECAQVASETLRDSARLIRENATDAAGAELRRRQRALLKSGITWYFSLDGAGDPQRQQEMLALFDKP
jgi:hypothetical protein